MKLTMIIRFVDDEGRAFDWHLPGRRVTLFRMNPTWKSYFSFRIDLFGWRKVWFSREFTVTPLGE